MTELVRCSTPLCAGWRARVRTLQVVLHAEENFDQSATYHKAIADIQTYLTLFDLDNSA